MRTFRVWVVFALFVSLPWGTVWVWAQWKKLADPPLDYLMIVDESLTGQGLERAISNTERAFQEFRFQWTRVKNPAFETEVRTGDGSRRRAIRILRNDRIPYRARSYRDRAGSWVIEANTKSWNARTVPHEVLHLVQALPRPKGAAGYIVNSLLDDVIDAEILARLARSRFRRNPQPVPLESRP